MSNLNLNSITSLDTGREVDVNRVMQTVDYVGGLVIDSLDTVIVDGNDRYALASDTPLPYTTTGAGMPEGGAFVSVGDTVLRQDLANPDKGAAMVARGVVAVDSIADLLALPEGQRKEGLCYLVKGYHAGSDAGGGEFYYNAERIPENDGGTVFDGFVRITDGRHVEIEWFGGVEGEDCTVAYQKAKEPSLPIKFGDGKWHLHGPQTLDVSIAGAGARKTELVFHQIPADEIALKNYDTNWLTIREMTLMGASWDAVDGALGYGFVAIAITHLIDAWFVGFKKTNVLYCHGPDSNGPYYSELRNIYSEYSGQHGIVIGTGANAVIITNPVCRWNGATEFMSHPGVGNYDGLIIGSEGDCNPFGYPKFTPEGVALIGGDCSYNSRYGWNINDIMSSSIATGYSELNKHTDNIAVGPSCRSSTLNFMMGGRNSIAVNSTQATANPCQITVAGRNLGTGHTTEGSILPTDAQLKNVRSMIGSGSNAVVYMEPKPTGYVRFFGEGHNPNIDFDLQVKIQKLLLGDGNLVAQETPTATHTIRIDVNGVEYKLLAIPN